MINFLRKLLKLESEEKINPKLDWETITEDWELYGTSYEYVAKYDFWNLSVFYDRDYGTSSWGWKWRVRQGLAYTQSSKIFKTPIEAKLACEKYLGTENFKEYALIWKK